MPVKNNTTFYKVDLVCNVTSNIGCGSRSKPILLELEKKNNIVEVKLNRKGDILVVVWNKSDITSRSVIIASVFEKYDIVISYSDKNSFEEQFSSFLNDGENWLNAENIDELSKIEAGLIAENLINLIEIKSKLTSKFKTILKDYKEALFFDFFLNFENMQQLSDTATYRKLVRKIIKTSKKYITFDSIPDENSLLNAIDGHFENKEQIRCCN